jgi:predicted nucleic acid-binding protein
MRVTTFYLDSSALSKRYVEETGTPWLRGILTPTAGNAIVIARITMVELHSALARRLREGSVEAQACLVALQAFNRHCATEYKFVDLDPEVVGTARDLLDHHPLRAYDAVQLASDLRANRALYAARIAPLVFTSADARLLAAAAREGLSADNPNAHP